jgi:hypothetical protein
MMDHLPDVWRREDGFFGFHRDSFVEDALWTLSQQAEEQGWTDEELDTAVKLFLSEVYKKVLN